MKCKIILVIIFSAISQFSMASSDLSYLPKDVKYRVDIPKPADVLGYPVGTWHARHDQLLSYLKALSERSDRVSWMEIGKTHENRQLMLMAISSKQNKRRLQEIQQAHLQTALQGESPDPEAPLIIWMGYGVHGNEPSTSNAAMLVAYYLAAGEGKAVQDLLDKAIILLDPAMNPDGMARFAQWVNMYKGRNLVSDPQHREHVEAWPSGRTNHYWFDLNRDWLLLTHPESRARVKQFQQWRPHVLTDFHEMGTNSTYFFQPGIPSRKNPWTPEENVELTLALAKHHAKALDAAGELYFTEESFDDFYYGKGSTYPDAHGAIGILFEQASSRGHLQDSIHGPLSFQRTIQNQVTTSLSTFAGALANKQALLNYQSNFFAATQKLIDEDKTAGYVLTEKHDASRFQAFKKILQQHQIEFSYLDKTVEIENESFAAGTSIFVPLAQNQYRLIKSIFSTRQSFEDNTFYDVSNWNLALAFNLRYQALEKRQARRLSLTDQSAKSKQAVNELDKNAYAYAFSWQDSQAPRLLQQLLSNGIKAKVAGKPFTAVLTGSGSKDFGAGAVVIAAGASQPENYIELMQQISTELELPVWSLKSGLTPKGIDLGSRNMRNAASPKLLIVGGRQTSQYEVGEAWHYLDTRLDLPASIVELDRLARVDLGKYSHILMVQGNYRAVSEQIKNKLGDWLAAGGVLIGQKTASQWFSQNKWLEAEYLDKAEIDKAFDTETLSYQDKESLAAKKRIAGAVFKTQIDLSHPLLFGYQTSELPVFRNHSAIMKVPDKLFITPIKYSAKPLMAGYASDEVNALIGNTAAVVAHNVGSGKIIAFVDNHNFRGYWYGTGRLLANAIYMAGLINAQG